MAVPDEKQAPARAGTSNSMEESTVTYDGEENLLPEEHEEKYSIVRGWRILAFQDPLLESKFLFSRMRLLQRRICFGAIFNLVAQGFMVVEMLLFSPTVPAGDPQNCRDAMMMSMIAAIAFLSIVTAFCWLSLRGVGCSCLTPRHFEKLGVVGVSCITVQTILTNQYSLSRMYDVEFAVAFPESIPATETTLLLILDSYITWLYVLFPGRVSLTWVVCVIELLGYSFRCYFLGSAESTQKNFFNMMMLTIISIVAYTGARESERRARIDFRRVCILRDQAAKALEQSTTAAEAAKAAQGREIQEKAKRFAAEHRLSKVGAEVNYQYSEVPSRPCTDVVPSHRQEGPGISSKLSKRISFGNDSSSLVESSFTFANSPSSFTSNLIDLPPGALVALLDTSGSQFEHGTLPLSALVSSDKLQQGDMVLAADQAIPCTPLRATRVETVTHVPLETSLDWLKLHFESVDKPGETLSVVLPQSALVLTEHNEKPLWFPLRSISLGANVFVAKATIPPESSSWKFPSIGLYSLMGKSVPDSGIAAFQSHMKLALTSDSECTALPLVTMPMDSSSSTTGSDMFLLARQC